MPFDKFQSLDEDKSGFIPKKVFLDVFAFFNLHYEESSIQDIFCLLDSKGSSRILYKVFGKQL
jgi:Ca2+-binding EF-hand superfamily protein